MTKNYVNIIVTSSRLQKADPKLLTTSEDMWYLKPMQLLEGRYFVFDSLNVKEFTNWISWVLLNLGV